MTAAWLLLATFFVVFALGLQSLNVNGGHRLLAVLTSLVIGASNLVLFKLLPGPTHWLEIAAYLAGGPLGIVASMAAHPQLLRLVQRRAVPGQDLVDAWRRVQPPAVPVAAPTTTSPTPLASGEPGIRVSGAHMRRHELLMALAADLCHPEAYGHAVNGEIKNASRRARGLPTLSLDQTPNERPREPVVPQPRRDCWPAT